MMQKQIGSRFLPLSPSLVPMNLCLHVLQASSHHCHRSGIVAPTLIFEIMNSGLQANSTRSNDDGCLNSLRICYVKARSRCKTLHKISRYIDYHNKCTFLVASSAG